jgi:hypothetical protein
MKILSTFILMCLLGAGAFAAEPKVDRDQQELESLTKEVQGQLTAIAENQKKIDAKTASIAEAVRLAKIYASRGGG